jgi:hypothetical protein
MHRFKLSACSLAMPLGRARDLQRVVSQQIALAKTQTAAFFDLSSLASPPLENFGTSYLHYPHMTGPAT